jgi:DNA/RNA endonuclease YhcR with UshA esterase domain
MEDIEMKKALVLVSVGLVMLFAAGVALALDQIVNIHVNDVNGVPVAPYAVGTVVNIEGIITAEFTTASVSYSRGFIQDETGGINYYYTGTHVCFALGDDVSITGTIAQYNGMTEVMISSYTINSHGNPLPAPKLITVADLIGTFQANYTEPDEGRLVKIGNVTVPGASGNWSSKNFSINDGANTDTLYIYGGSGCAVHPLIGTPVPTGLFCVIGILTQFDTNSPYISGYQISPRVVPDIILGQTAVENATWGRIKSLFR